MSISRLKVGIDVPWVTSWTSEPLLGVRPCATVGGQLAAWQADRPGEGRPQYSRNHMIRQRRSVAEMLCPMCGEPTPPDDRWTQTARRTSAGAMRARGLGALLPAELKDAAVMVDAGAIAPLHRACAERSLAQCPHLAAMEDAEVRPFPPGRVVAPLLIEAFRPRADGRGEDPIAAVGFLQIFGITGELDKRWRKDARRLGKAAGA
jgi:hypothetical protein